MTCFRLSPYRNKFFTLCNKDLGHKDVRYSSCSPMQINCNNYFTIILRDKLDEAEIKHDHFASDHLLLYLAKYDFYAVQFGPNHAKSRIFSEPILKIRELVSVSGS